jgi:hypothetical protein
VPLSLTMYCRIVANFQTETHPRQRLWQSAYQLGRRRQERRLNISSNEERRLESPCLRLCMRPLERQHFNINNNENLTVIPFCYCVAYSIYLRCYGLESMHVVFVYFLFYHHFLSIAKACRRGSRNLSWDHIFTGRLTSRHLA